MEIRISDCLKRLEGGETIDLEVWQYDSKRKKGGDIDRFSCQLLTGIEHQTVSGRPLTESEKVEAGSDDIDDNTLHHRKPNHSKWYTRNVRIVVNGHPSSIIRKIHPLLIKSLNGIKTVP
jgi:hypothetical protein